MIETCAELGNAREDTLSKIMEKFALDQAEANRYMEEYWKQ